MNYDIIIDKIFFINDKYNLSNVVKYNKHKKYKYKNLQNYIINRFKDSLSERETLYRIHYNIENIPICPICGNKIKFFGRKNILYLSHCSNKCKKLDENVNNKWRQSCENNIGTNREKSKNTMKIRYGVENPYQIPEIIEKIKKINKEKEKESLEKQQQTCLKKYGVKSYLQTKEIKKQTRETSLIKYGVDHPMKSQEIKNKYNWNEITNKIYLTKKKNNSFNISKTEYNSYLILKEKYPDIITQYKCELYPFNCDFYIPSLDLYIECNYHWSHCKHPFNPNNIEDINKLNKMKLKNTKYYLNSIYVWTDLDIRKRNIAKQNNLNYIEFWNIEELKEWIKKMEN